MSFEPISITDEDYVVIDVETTGVSAIEDDILSISLYRPDNSDAFTRLLPLERRRSIPVAATDINGILDEDVRGKPPLEQAEVDALIERFELAGRTILHFGSLDEEILRTYFIRHGLQGFETLRFFNFKKMFCAEPRFKGLTKDSLCLALGIDGVTEVHTGANDCILEWKLFEKLGGKPVLAERSAHRITLRSIERGYLVPATKASYSNMSQYAHIPTVSAAYEEVFRYTFSQFGILHHGPTTGRLTEEVLATLLNARRVSGDEAAWRNSGKLTFLTAYLASYDGHFLGRPEQDDRHTDTDGHRDSSNGENVLPVLFFGKRYELELYPNGLFFSRDKDGELAADHMNDSSRGLLAALPSVARYLKENVFGTESVLFQEPVVDEKNGCMALCDLSSESAIVEIKAFKMELGKVDRSRKEAIEMQMFLEARGRDAYLLAINWNYLTKGVPSGLTITLNRVLLAETGKITPKHSRSERYVSRVREKSRGAIEVDPMSYVGNKERVTARCLKCGHEWRPVAKSLMDRCRCPQCKAGKKG